ncbi:DNA methyltransferase [Corynebacterium aurimucosum]
MVCSLSCFHEFCDCSLATHVVMDPACGSGNFLIVAYRELRKIEIDVIVAIREREGNNTMLRLLAWERVGEDA